MIGIGTLGSLAATLARLYSPGALVAYGVRDGGARLRLRLGVVPVHVSEEDAVA